jgi:hypothetical protein
LYIFDVKTDIGGYMRLDHGVSAERPIALMRDLCSFVPSTRFTVDHQQITTPNGGLNGA